MKIIRVQFAPYGDKLTAIVPCCSHVVRVGVTPETSMREDERRICLWLLDPGHNSPPGDDSRTWYLYNNGQEVRSPNSSHYVGTSQLNGVDSHVFEQGPRVDVEKEIDK